MGPKLAKVRPLDLKEDQCSKCTYGEVSKKGAKTNQEEGPCVSPLNAGDIDINTTATTTGDSSEVNESKSTYALKATEGPHSHSLDVCSAKFPNRSPIRRNDEIRSYERDDKDCQEEEENGNLFRRRISQTYLRTNFVHILFGIGTFIYCTYFGDLENERYKFYLNYVTLHHDVIITIIKTAAVIQMLAGFIGVIWSNWCKRFQHHLEVFFRSYGNYLKIVLCLNIGASFLVALTSVRPLHEALDNVMTTEVFHWTHHKKLHPLVSTGELHLMDKMQREFHCCGLHDFRDWYFSQYAAIPESCCNKTYLQKCLHALISKKEIARQDFNVLKREILPWAWNQSCMSVFHNEIATIRTHWTMVIYVLLIIQVLLFSWSHFLFSYVRIHHLSDKDLTKLNQLRRSLKVWAALRRHELNDMKNVSTIPVTLDDLVAEFICQQRRNANNTQLQTRCVQYNA